MGKPSINRMRETLAVGPEHEPEVESGEALEIGGTCIAGWIRMNGVGAFALFDSGSNADAPGRRLFKSHQTPVHPGTAGSRAAINYGPSQASQSSWPWSIHPLGNMHPKKGVQRKVRNYEQTARAGSSRSCPGDGRP